ncbi:MAG: ABC transporter ATP-binding protein, partial [Beijerinckiaceae bacterium]|nr:ABC transporter ATP-binding protein [Beijerinckiaceae bacterium]
RTARADQRREAAQKRAELAPLKKQVTAAEKVVERLSATVAKLDQLLADPAFYARDPEKAKKAGIERGQLAKQLGEAEDTWLRVSAAYDEARLASGE